VLRRRAEAKDGGQGQGVHSMFERCAWAMGKGSVLGRWAWTPCYVEAREQRRARAEAKDAVLGRRARQGRGLGTDVRGRRATGEAVLWIRRRRKSPPLLTTRRARALASLISVGRRLGRWAGVLGRRAWTPCYDDGHEHQRARTSCYGDGRGHHAWAAGRDAVLSAAADRDAALGRRGLGTDARGRRATSGAMLGSRRRRKWPPLLTTRARECAKCAKCAKAPAPATRARACVFDSRWAASNFWQNRRTGIG
jgi:hypothetical protein